MPLSSYRQVVWRLGPSTLSQPRCCATGVRSVSRPWVESSPAVALPLLYSMTSGTSSELSTMGAVWRICSNPLISSCTLTSGCLASKRLIASAQAMPMAPSADS